MGQINYFSEGSDLNPVIVYLHGFMGTAVDWKPVIELLGNSYHHVAIDIPVLSPEEIFQSLNTIPGLNPEKKMNLVGYSMGGRIALYLAVHYSQFINAVIIESAMPGTRSANELQERIKFDEQLKKKLVHCNREDFWNEWYSQEVFANIRQRQGYDKMLERRIQFDPQIAARHLQKFSVSQMESLWPDLVEIKNPLLYIAGELDKKYIRVGSEVTNLCHSAKLKIVKGAGHNVHFEEPQAFAESINDFLRRKNSE